MLSKLIAALQNAELEMTAAEIADMLWLASHMGPVPESSHIEPHFDISDGIGADDNQEAEEQPSQERPQPPSTDIHVSPQYADGNSDSHLTGLPFRSPAASALPNALALARALRPLMRRLSSKTSFVLNENATVQTIAETQNTIWLPVLDPAPVRWFDVALVIDDGTSMMLWKQTIVELRALLEHQGAFRDVRVWKLATDDKNLVQLYAETGSTKEKNFLHNPKELIDPSGHRLILVVTDCVSLAWHSGGVQQLLDIWGKKNLVTLIQMLPRRLWHQTALGVANTVQIDASPQEASNARLKTVKPFQWFDEDISLEASFPIPVVTLEPRSLLSWARVITGSGDTWITGKVFERNPDQALNEDTSILEEPLLSAIKRVQLFRANASLPARKLAGLLAAAPIPISLHVIRLIQHTILPEAGQVHIAEVLLSGLLEEVYRDEMVSDLDHIEYDFMAGVRDELLNAVPIPDGQRVLKELSTFIRRHYGQTRDFLALISTQEMPTQGVTVTRESRPFAQIAATVLRRFGGDFASLAEMLEQQMKLLDAQPVETLTVINEDRTILETPQTYAYSVREESVSSSRAFLSKTWCDLNWSEWIPFDSPNIKLLPTGGGVYRIRAIGGNELFYIGHTGRNVRERIGSLINAMKDPSQMPFSDPHTAAPALWAWRDAEGMNFECSAAALTFSDEEREALVHYLLWQYRLELGHSTRCNYGRIHSKYVKSSKRSTGHRGYRLPEGQVNNTENLVFPPLHLIAIPHEKTWMGLKWSNFYVLTSSIQDMPSSGVYKILDTDTNQLLFIGYSTNLRAILQSQARKNWRCPNPSFAFSALSDDLHTYQVAEIESDLIGGYYAQTKTVPNFQFKNYRDVVEETQPDEVAPQAPQLIPNALAFPLSLRILANALKARKVQVVETYHLLLTSTISLTSDVIRNICAADSWAEFRSYFQAIDVASSDRIDLLTEYIGIHNNLARYQALAYLIKEGYFSTILTTNLDSTLEDALLEVGLQPTAFQVLIVGHDSDEAIIIALESRIPGIRIIKLHGSLHEKVLPEQFPDFFETPVAIRESLKHYLSQNIVIVGSMEHDDDIMRLFNSNRASSIYYILSGINSNKEFERLKEVRMDDIRTFYISEPYGEIETFFNTLTSLLLFVADILLVTITEIEARAVLNCYPKYEVCLISERVYYDFGIIGETRVFMVQSEIGSDGLGGSRFTVEEGIRALSPSAVIMVGIAFGFNGQKQHIGDILVSRQLVAYELQRVAGNDPTGKRTIPMLGDRISASIWLLDRFKAGLKTWQESADIYFGTILSGTKLVDNQDFRDQLHQMGQEAIGGEMEGIGLCEAARRYKVDWILVKGVSDWADGNKHEDKSKSNRQEEAAYNAARFTLHAIQQGGFRNTHVSNKNLPKDVI